MQVHVRCWCSVLVAVLFLQWSVQAQEAKQVLSRHVRPAVISGQAKAIGALPATQRMNVSIVLPLRNQDQLKGLLSRLYDPSSPDYHHFLSVAQFTEQFGPTADDYQKVVDFARANGFAVTRASANRMVVPISGTADQVQRAFNVSMKLYQHPTENRTFFSPDREPALALDVPIAHIVGLNNFSVPRPMLLKPSAVQALTSASIQGSGPSGSYLSSDMRAAYYGGTALTGTGQTVGLVQFDGYNIGDVTSSFAGKATSSANGRNYVLTYTPTPGGASYTVPINNVLLDGATGQPGQFISPTDDAEQVLDIVQAVGMAPGLSQVLVYIGRSDAEILNQMASDNVAKQVSISWTWSPDDPSTDEPIFEEFAAQGQSVFAASGDYGAFSPSFASYYPQEDSWVTAVGGTTLTTNGAGGTWASETAWSRSGGGVSPDGISIPGYQSGLATLSNGGSTTRRNAPDVAMEADFDNYDCNMSACAGTYAGTSFAAPRWAGFMALVNQQSVASGGTTLGFFNMPLYSAAEGAASADILHDVATGNNGYESGYSFNAVAGYDLATGWGSPNGQALIDLLAPPSATGFELSATPGFLTIDPGSSNRIAVSVHSTGGFAGAVSLSISGLPAGVSGSFSPQSTTGTSTLTLTADANILGGTSFPQIIGTSGAVTESTNLSLTLNAPLTAISIGSPAVPLAPVLAQNFKPGTSIPVIGSIVGSYQNLVIQWAEGANPASGWSNAGITLNSSLPTPLTNQTMGTWDTSSITQADYFTIQVTATVSGVPCTIRTVVYLEPDLLSASWPQWWNADSMQMQGPVPAIDASGTTRVAFANADIGYSSQDSSRIRSISADGSSILSMPFPQDGTWSQPAVGNLDMAPGDELVGTDSEDVEVFHPDGTSYKLAPDPSLGYLFFYGRAPIIADVDGDSLPEIVAMGTELNSGGNGGTPSGQAYVFAWRNHGQLLNSNFPITVPDRNLTLTEYGVPRVVVGDVNGDGAQEFVVIEGTSNGVITPRLFGATGIQKSWGAQPINGVPCQLSLVDLDHNGTLETILLTCDGKLHVLQPDGTERSGWPQSVAYTMGGVAVGDLNRDGKEEIVASDGNLYIFNADGTPFSGTWPMMGNYNPSSEFFYGAAVLADVNGDGYPEIVTTRYTDVPNGPLGLGNYLTAQLLVLDRFGTTLRSWNLPGSHSETPGEFVYPSVADFNQDGLAEIALQYGLVSSESAPPTSLVTMLTTGASFNPSANDWPMGYQNPQNTSVLRRVAASVISILPPSSEILAGQPAQFTLTVAAAAQNTKTPTGVANLIDGAQNIGSCVLSSGSCVVSATLALGTHNLVAGYVGDTSFGTSYSATLVELVDLSSAATPTFNVPSGTYTTPQTVTLSDTTAGVTIYYTTNGATPSASSTRYSGPIVVSASETIKAIAIGSGCASSVASAAYIIAPPAALPTFNVPSGTYTTAQTVTLSDATAGVNIYYTIDGSTPTTNSTRYSGSITVTSSETVEAIASGNGYSSSAIASATYTIAPPQNPAPSIGSLSPAYTSAGNTAQTLSVGGSGFTAASTVYWGASALVTQFVSATQLTAQLPASDIGTAGVFPITVATPAPGGGVSNAFQFEVDSAGSGSSASSTFSTNAATVAAGSTANYPVTLSTSATGVSATCLNLPAGATCSYSAATGAVTIATSPATPAGTYQVTVVFSETLPGSASALLLAPFLLLPLAFARKRLAAKGVIWSACLGFILLACVAWSTGCGGSSPSTGTTPSSPTHQATSSGVVSLTIR